MEELLLSVYGILQALVFAYIPGVKNWYENKLGKDKTEEEKATLKRGVQALGILIVAGVIFGLNCTGFSVADIACSTDGALTLVLAYIAALGANQITYWVAPQKAKKRP
jgi:hypothetical protein